MLDKIRKQNLKEMKKLFSKLFMVGALGLFAMSCGDDDNEAITPVVDPEETEDPFDARINNNSADSLTATVFLSDVDDNIIDVLLSFTSTEDMTRVYVTENFQGQGDEKLDASDAFGVNDKGDGSIDLNSDLKNGFQFSLDFSTTGLPTEGTIVYKFWATAGKGDFRDMDKRLAEGPAILTIDLGGTNPATQVKSYTATMLAAPLADGSSETFFSLLDGEVYRVDEGEEFSALWDFGYYYGATGLASLAAAGNYPTSIIDVATVANTTDAELNSCFFKLSTSTSDDFDGIEVSNNLNFISASTEERLNQIDEGDIIEFVDNYGKKGLIRVTSITPGFGNDGQMTIEVKVQP